jgi:hypothetical protein
MKRILLGIALSLFCYVSFAQTDDSGKYASEITEPLLQKHLTIIAGKEMEGRETGTEGQRKAAAYIQSQFEAIGLKIPEKMNSYQQYYPLYRDSMVSSSLRAGNYDAVLDKDYLPGTMESNKAKGKRVVFAGYGISDKNYDDYANIEVNGKVLIIFAGEPVTDGKYLVSGTAKKSEWSRRGMMKKITTAADKGAVALLVINPSMEIFNQQQINRSHDIIISQEAQKNTSKLLPFSWISHEFAKKLMGENIDPLIAKAKSGAGFTSADSWSKKILVKIKQQQTTTKINASNVLGIIEGTDKKDEYVFLTGHYDHLGKHDGEIYYGADDDGSGTVGVIAMATAFAKAKAEGKGPRRTVVFMTVSGEEKGLWGSEYYSDHPVYPLSKTSVDLNTDMVGRVDTERSSADSLNYLYVVGHDKISSELPLINEAVNARYTGLTLDYKFDDPNDPERIYYRSDHYNFARKGVPVLFFYDGMLKADYHKPTDTVDKINWALYEKRVRMIFHTAWEMANRDEMLKRDKPLPEGTR